MRIKIIKLILKLNICFCFNSDGISYVVQTYCVFNVSVHFVVLCTGYR